MFLATYKTTLKTLVRSVLLWIVFFLVIFSVMNQAMGERVRIAILDEEYKTIGYISDLDPEYVLTYDKYIQTILNSCKSWTMLYAMPIFCVIVTVLVLNRDYSDDFFEIEKSNGVKSIKYFVGRFIAMLNLCIFVCLLITFLGVHYYYFTRGGVHDFTLTSYLIDSTVRIIRVFCCAMFPGILFYISLTYVFGCVMKSGFGGAVVGIGYILFENCTKSFLSGRLPEIYHNYLTPNPSKLYQYWTFYDTEWFTEKLSHNPFNNYQMIGSFCIITTFSFICLVVSNIILKNRKI